MKNLNRWKPGLCIAACLLLGIACSGRSAHADDEAGDEAGDEADLGPGVSLTVYNQNFAIIKERRQMPFEAGVSVVQFPDVAATIVPETVQFSALRPGGVSVLEQNYEFDLVSASKLLEKYIDRPISIVARDAGLIDGTLLSSDDAQIVLSDDSGIQLIPRRKNVKDIRFASLPEGLLTRPTLVWKVDAEQAGEHLVKIAYRANNIKWRADYRAVAAADEKTIDVSGWVTINNHTGKTFEDAGLKLMAGDVHVDEKPRMIQMGLAVRRMDATRKNFEEKTFAEYHLYTLSRPTTLASAQIKQIELVKIENIPVTKGYEYRPAYGTRVATMLEFKNSKETNPGLGIPLPKGPFRVYQRDTDGQTEFVGKDEIDHTPKDEPVRLKLGFAFDLTANRVQTAFRQRGGERWIERDWKITLRNHKDQPVTISVEEPLQVGRNIEILKQSQESKWVDFHTLSFHPQVPANGQVEITYTVRYTW